MKLDTEQSRSLDELRLALARIPGLRRVFEVAFERRFRANDRLNLYRGIYPSHAAALASIPADRRGGFDNAGSAELYRDRLRRVFPSDYPAMLWVQKAFDGGCRRVFDVGGHIGIAYYAYQRYLEFPQGLSWTVLDVPAVAAAGQAWAREHDPAGRLRFAQRFEDAEGCDLLFASGSLQYLPDSLAELLQRLAGLPLRIVVNLLPLHASESFYTVQGIATAMSPYRVSREGEFMAAMRGLGYDVQDRWDNAEKACRIHLEPGRSLDRYTGASFARRG